MPPGPMITMTPSRITIKYDPESLMEYQECTAILSTETYGKKAKLLKSERGLFEFKVFPRTNYMSRLIVCIKKYPNISSEGVPIELRTPGMIFLYYIDNRKIP